MFFFFLHSSVLESLCILDGVRMSIKHRFLLCHSFNVFAFTLGVTPPGDAKFFGEAAQQYEHIYSILGILKGKNKTTCGVVEQRMNQNGLLPSCWTPPMYALHFSPAGARSELAAYKVNRSHVRLLLCWSSNSECKIRTRTHAANIAVWLVDLIIKCACACLCMYVCIVV